MGDAVGDGDGFVVVGKAGLRTVSPAAANAAPIAQAAALQSAYTALAARVASLEGKPEEVAHFGATGRFPNVAALATFTVTLTGLVSAVPGDVLKVGETVEVRAVGNLPAGVEWRGQPTVPADGTIAVTFTAALALANAAPVAFAITALR